MSGLANGFFNTIDPLRSFSFLNIGLSSQLNFHKMEFFELPLQTLRSLPQAAIGISSIAKVANSIN